MVKVTFITPDDYIHDVEVPYGFTLMEAARRNNITGIDAECGGACACGTCLVNVEPEWFDKITEPDENEIGMLEFAIGRRHNSRLSCQIKITPQLEGLRVRLPAGKY